VVLCVVLTDTEHGSVVLSIFLGQFWLSVEYYSTPRV
jgi:hypothetical protein